MTAEPTVALRSLIDALQRFGVTEYALTGGIAFGVWVEPRHTKDFDLCVRIGRATAEKLAARFDGQPIGGGERPSIVRFEIQGWQVDLFNALTAYDDACLSRARVVELLGIEVPVVRPEDLVLHKLLKLQDDKRRLPQDAADLSQLLALGDLDWPYLETWLPKLGVDFLRKEAPLEFGALVARLQALR